MRFVFQDDKSVKKVPFVTNN